jgi:ABC-type multidrug transport system fused ATPase/permease subunit
MRRGALTIFVTHRISLLGSFDTIWCVNAGVISSVGTHAELMTNSSEYRQIFDMKGA